MSERRQAGFTMIELMMAMAVFSFMLLIIIMGFMNIVRMHNQALASNMAQDNARTAIDELVRAVRDSSGIIAPGPGASASRLCLANANGPEQVFYVDQDSRLLMRGDGCGSNPANLKAITSKNVQVAHFMATVRTTGASIVKPQADITVTVASNNGTTTGSGADIACGPSNTERTFCSTVTLTSGAVPR